MQDPNLMNKLEIVSPNCAKSVTFCFNSDQNKPLQLISWSETKGFVVNPEAQKFFDTLQDNNLGIITIVGKNRTGKSYLLNRVVLNQNSGFSVGHTINPCTKGVWVWPHVIEIENKNNETEKLKVIVMDTEGTDATDQHENYDTKVFMLGMLLSSYFIYNSVGAIDEKAIQNLSLIINLSKHLQKTNEKEFEDLMECFPSFLWVVRDFALKLIDTQGNPITAKEYLENALKPQKGISETVEAKNRIRRLLANFFKDRDCFMMVRPTETENDMQHLHQLKPESLRPEFNEQVNSLRRKIWFKVKPKQFRGKTINGPAFIVLCKLLCNMLNNGETLSLENSWNSICKIECDKIVKEISEKYEQQMRKELDKGTLNEQTMTEMHKKRRNEAMESFKKRAMGDQIKEFESIMDDMLKQRYKSLKKLYYSRIESRMKETVEEKLEVLQQKIQKKQFTNFSQLVIDFKAAKVELQEDYRAPESRAALFDYLFQNFLGLAESYYEDFDASQKQNERIRKAEIENLEAKIASLQKEHEARMLENAESYKALELERHKLRSQIKSLEEKMHELEQEKSHGAKFELQLDELSKEYQIKEAKLTSENEESRKQIENLGNEKQDLIREKQELIKDKEGLVKEKEALTKENKALTKEKENLTKEKQVLLKEKQDLMKDKESLVNEKQDLIREKHELIKEKQELVNEKQNLINEKQDLLKDKHELTKESEKGKNHERQVGQKDEQIVNLNQTIMDLKKELKQERQAHKASIQAMEEIKKMMAVSPIATKRKETSEDCRCRVMDEVLKENKELKRNIDILNARMESNVNEFYLQRNDLDNKLQEIERHYREKQLQDEFTIATLKSTITQRIEKAKS